MGLCIPALHLISSGVYGSIKTGLLKASQKNNLKMLVWYEIHDDINEAIRREKQIKKWERKWKLRIIEEMNPDWVDLYHVL